MKFLKCVIIDQCILLCNIIIYTLSIVQAYVGPNVREAESSEFPFIVGVVTYCPHHYGERNILCTTTLITKRDILTVEHCFLGRNDEHLGVVIGSNDIQTEPNNGLKWWYSYNTWSQGSTSSNNFTRNDISVARLQTDVSKGTKIAKLKYKSSEELAGKHVTSVGWGKTQTDIFPRLLQKADLKILSKSSCERKLLEQTGENYNAELNHLCSVGNPYAIMMGGDSGGPLIYHNNIIAVSIGRSPFVLEEDIHPKVLNLHMNVYYYKEFIKDVVKYP